MQCSGRQVVNRGSTGEGGGQTGATQLLLQASPVIDSSSCLSPAARMVGTRGSGRKSRVDRGSQQTTRPRKRQVPPSRCLRRPTPPQPSPSVAHPR